MPPEKRVQLAFADDGISSGGEFYVPVSAAKRYIDACAQESLAIVGIEVFRLSESGMRPDLSHIADFSSLLAGAEVWDAIVRATQVEAHHFVEQAASEPNIWMNFTVLSADEWRVPARRG